MDPNFQKWTFLAFLSIELCACSSIFVAILVILISAFVNVSTRLGRRM